MVAALSLSKAQTTTATILIIQGINCGQGLHHPRFNIQIELYVARILNSGQQVLLFSQTNKINYIKLNYKTKLIRSIVNIRTMQ